MASSPKDDMSIRNSVPLASRSKNSISLASLSKDLAHVTICIVLDSERLEIEVLLEVTSEFWGKAWTACACWCGISSGHTLFGLRGVENSHAGTTTKLSYLFLSILLLLSAFVFLFFSFFFKRLSSESRKCTVTLEKSMCACVWLLVCVCVCVKLCLKRGVGGWSGPWVTVVMMSKELDKPDGWREKKKHKRKHNSISQEAPFRQHVM